MRHPNIGLLLILLAARDFALPQEYGKPDRESPGDEAVQAHLRQEAGRLDAAFAEDLKSREEFEKQRSRRREEYLYMLGLWPLPERTPLEVRVTGTLNRDGYVVDKLHYQSKPRLYVTANLYRPAAVPAGTRLPAVLYVCGHSGMGRNGNKTAFQSHGIWLAKHGYVALLVDTLQLGEIAAIHHGLYREGRWWWWSRGYTPAGVECWNGVRGIDYLASRPDVDPERIAVTGISGGGAATFWVAAADERVRAAAPVSGMADLESYCGNRVINGHCDCMFLHNAFGWPWTRIAALIAPRPLLFVNSDADAIFPMDANERITNRLERLYALHGAGHRFDTLVSIGGHAYRQDIRAGVYRFLNEWLKGDAREVTDSEADLETGEGNASSQRYPIPPEELRAFATDADLPKDELNTAIDRSFVPVAEVAVPRAGEFDGWRKGLVDELRRVAFASLAFRAPQPSGPESPRGLPGLEPAGGRPRVTPDEVAIHERFFTTDLVRKGVEQALLVVLHEEGREEPDWVRASAQGEIMVTLFPPRGWGETRWTRKNPPNFVERSWVLLGRTADAERVYDVMAAARLVRKLHPDLKVTVAGSGPAAVIAAYAALLEPEIAGAVLHRPPLTHMDPEAPQFLNALRVCDIPEVLGMLAPRPVTVLAADPSAEGLKKAARIYEAAGAAAKWKVEAGK